MKKTPPASAARGPMEFRTGVRVHACAEKLESKISDLKWRATFDEDGRYVYAVAL
jgi:hypothetical protein